MVENYYEKRAAKAQRYEKLAQKNLTQSNELYDKAHGMASCIPFGQPILVGHHSESRDRNFRKKLKILIKNHLVHLIKQSITKTKLKMQ